MIGYPKITIDMDDPEEDWETAYQTIRTGKADPPEPPGESIGWNKKIGPGSESEPTAAARERIQDLIDAGLRLLRSMEDDRG